MHSETTDPIKIVVADDAPDVRCLFRLILQSEGYTVFEADDGQTALDLFTAHTPDIVLLDMIMPNMDGIEACRQIQMLPEGIYTPVLIYTVFGPSDARWQLALDAGAIDVIQMPVGPRELMRYIERAIQIRLRRLLQRAAASAAPELNSPVLAHLQALSQKVQAAIRELREANTKLEQANQLKANLLSIISHELRTPFVPLNTALQAFPRYSLDGLHPEQRELFEQITAHTAHAYRKIAHLIKYADLFSKHGQLQRERVNLSTLIAQAVEAITPLLLPRQQRLITDVAPNLFMSADQTLIGEALWELLDNAIKFTPPGGQITVRAYQNEEHMVLHVADTGPGIAPKYHNVIWKSFAQLSEALKRGEDGLGMGLALVQYVAEAHRGGVMLESSPGQGSVFGMWIPLHAPRT